MDNQPSPYELDFGLDLRDLPPGEYLAEVEELRLAMGPSGYPYYGTTFSIREPEQHEGKTIWKALSFTPTRRRLTLAWLDAMAGEALPRARVNLDDYSFQQQFLHRWVRLTIGLGVDRTGQPEPDVKGVYAAAQPPQQPPAPRPGKPKLFAQHEPTVPPTEEE